MTTIQGNGQEFTKLLSNMQKETGVLAFRNNSGKFCLHLKSSVIQAVFVDGRPLRDVNQARDLLLEQLCESSGECEFEEALPEDLRKGMNICVDGLLSETPSECGCIPRAPEPQMTIKSLFRKLAVQFKSRA